MQPASRPPQEEQGATFSHDTDERSILTGSGVELRSLEATGALPAALGPCSAAGILPLLPSHASLLIRDSMSEKPGATKTLENKVDSRLALDS